jgi:hypothetical protein
MFDRAFLLSLAILGCSTARAEITVVTVKTIRAIDKKSGDEKTETVLAGKGTLAEDDYEFHAARDQNPGKDSRELLLATKGGVAPFGIKIPLEIGKCLVHFMKGEIVSEIAMDEADLSADRLIDFKKVKFKLIVSHQTFPLEGICKITQEELSDMRRAHRIRLQKPINERDLNPGKHAK